VVITEKPKLGRISEDARGVAKALSVSADKIHLKAKTERGR